MINNISINDNDIVLNIENLENEFFPYFFKRVSHTVSMYHDIRLPMEFENGKYVMSFLDFYKHLKPNKFYIYDCVVYRRANECRKEIKLNAEIAKTFTDSIGEVEVPVGKIKYELYKNGGNGLSLKIKLVPTIYFHVVSQTENEKETTLIVETNVKDSCKFKLMKRSAKQYKQRWTVRIELKSSKQRDGKYEVIVPKNNLLKNYCHDSKEIWDMVAETNEKFLPVVCKTSLSNNYFEMNDQFTAKLFISENSYLAVFTRENLNKHQKKIKVAIHGSCYTKEAFHSLDFNNPDYKRFYENNLIGFHESLIAMMSDPIPYNEQDLDGKCVREIKKYSPSHFNKTFLSDLKEYNPDYLIMDNYPDIAALLFEVSETQYLTETFFLSDTKCLKEMKVKHKYGLSSDERFELFKKAVDKFSEKIRTIIDPSKIVLIRAYPATQKYEGNKIVDWPEKVWVEYVRKIWQRNDDYFIEKIPEARIIDMRKDYISFKSPNLSFSTNHFTDDYYKDVLNKFNKIVLQDLLKEEGGKWKK